MAAETRALPSVCALQALGRRDVGRGCLRAAGGAGLPGSREAAEAGRPVRSCCRAPGFAVKDLIGAAVGAAGSFVPGQGYWKPC